MQVSTLKPCTLKHRGDKNDMYVCESFGVLINQFYITEVENVICFNLLGYPYFNSKVSQYWISRSTFFFHFFCFQEM